MSRIILEKDSYFINFVRVFRDFRGLVMFLGSSHWTFLLTLKQQSPLVSSWVDQPSCFHHLQNRALLPQV